jgi:hypothetical protein
MAYLIEKDQIENLQIIDEDVAEGAAIATSKLADGDDFERKSNKVTSLNEESTNVQFPGAKLMFDELGEKENISNKNVSGGYAGLTLFKLNLLNALGTITNFFTTASTVARTWIMPDKDGTVAMLSDIPVIDNSIDIPATTPGYDGTIIRLTAAVNLVFGDVCYINLNGKAALASAATEATATGVIMCVEPMLAANTEGTFLLYGILRKDTWNWTVGGSAGLIYLSIAGTSGNTLSQVVVSAEDNVSQILGFATHSTRMFFNPSLIQTVYKA